MPATCTGRAAPRRTTLLLLLALVLAAPACMSSYHTVGAGPTGGEIASAKQWYALWGCLPLGGAPDSRTLSGDRVNYRVWTGITTWDVFLNFLTLPVGFCRTSVIVEF